MRRIEWAGTALADLDRLEDFLFSKNPSAAKAAIAAIYSATRQLTDFPNSGRLARLDLRELPIRFSNSGYLVLYRIDETTIQIVRVRHQREAGY